MDAKMEANDSEHIWLRQAITFTVDGQTRTLEMSVPLPRSASPTEIERLLDLAEDGMSAISRRLDAHVARISAGESAPDLPSPLAPHPRGEGSQNLTPSPSPTRRGEPEEQPLPVAPSIVAAEPPVAPTATPEPVERPAARPEPPQRPTPAPATPAAPKLPPARPTPTPAAPVAAAPQAEMTRPEFLKSSAELGLNPRQAMDRLGVRSLEGLNLREALESLRRQMLGANADDDESEPATPASSTPAPAAATPASYFEEEDDETILYSLEEEDDLAEDDVAPAGSETAKASFAAGDNTDNTYEEDEDDLDEVPDLTPPPEPTRQRSTSATRPAESDASRPTVRETPPAEAAASNGARTRATQLIGRLRAATGGSPASDYQRTAYRNIVEEELGKTQANALVRGLWRTTADRLSGEQLDVLIRWGKEDTFGEEAVQVIAVLRAQQQRAAQEAHPDEESPNGATGRPASTRTATRGRASGSTH